MKGTRSLLAKTRILIVTGFASIFLILGIVLWYAMATLKTTNDSFATLIANTEEKTTAAYLMRDLVRQRATLLNKLQQDQNIESQDALKTRLGELTAKYNHARLALKVNDADEREILISEKINDVDQRIDSAYTKLGESMYSMYEDTKRVNTAIGEVQLLEVVLLNHLNDLVELEKTMASESLATNQNRYLDTQKILTILTILAFLVGLAIAMLVVRGASQASRRIAHQANHDELTGLGNRRAFESQIKTSLTQAAKGKQQFGLLYLDLDRFKVVNDTCGHHAGDQLLQSLTELVQSKLSNNDRMFRLGGDEFGIIAVDTDFSKIVDRADLIRDAADAFIFKYQRREFSISTSIGVIPLSGDQSDIERLMTEVDSACYIAKEGGRNRVHVAREDDAEVLRYKNNLANVEKIRQALNNEQFELFYQPVFNIADEPPTLQHCEILLRIKNSDGELYSPEEFIPLAEKYNLMGGIDRWVVTHVIEWIEEHQHAVQLPRFLINLSALSYTDDLFLAFLVKTLKNCNVDTSRIAFEITETAAVDNVDKGVTFINRLREFGCRFALDDFGTGFSTFAYLKQLPIDYLKIDGSLVRNICHDTVDYEMVRAINQVGHIVGAQTIAEFVEDDDILKALRTIGVDHGQGFGLQRPARLANLLQQAQQRIEDNQDNQDNQAGTAA